MDEVEEKVYPANLAKIIDPYKIVINRGNDHGIEEGQKFLLYALGDEITDPSSGESLGRLEIVKGIGVVTHVQDKMSIIQSTKKNEKIRRVLKRNPYSLFPFRDEEEIIDSAETLPFEDPEVGDLLKPI